MDIVISDLGVPGINGWEVGKRIKRICQQKGWAKPLIAICTGWGAEVRSDREKISTGVDLVVAKPISIPNLLGSIGEILEQRGY